MRKFFLTSLCLLTAASGLFADAWNGWSKFKPGSFAKYKTTTTVATTKMTSDTKITLLSVANGKATIETEVNMMGNASKAKSEVPLDGKAGATTQATPVKKGTESLTVNGKSFQCDTYEVDSNTNGMAVHTKSWVSSEVPGGLVKSVSTTSGAAKSATTMELVDFKN